ncbi:MAG: tetratricopeptide repeat protein [Spirochaetaceae bacterium]|jgi:tetratricopeptide (TPR) repeat protein|nr:tetratricopeptide repeat protein [Spirochaetaceae bacterium]
MRKASSFLLLYALVVTVIPLAAQSPRADALAAYNTGRDLEARGRTQEAESSYRDAVRICNEEISSGIANADTYAVLTWTLQRQRKYGEVITMGERALRLGNDLRIVETMGEAHFYLGNYAASLYQMQRYVNALPQGGRASVAYFFIGEIFRLQGKNLSADIAYTTALHIEGGGVALWWYRLGQVREADKDYREAVKAYEAALRITPGYRQAREGLERSRQVAG